jgi:EAL domain-containing protein (putative c-di-GMP-specific phosphodiesterase class I)
MDSARPHFEFSFAFQPIVDASAHAVISFEALVRGPRGESSAEIFARIPPDELHSYDHAFRVKAIGLAARLDLRTYLNLNFLPNSARRSSEYLNATLRAARQAGFPVERLVFEITEKEYRQHLGIVEGAFGSCSALGFQTAIDDFGTGFSGLRRLAEYQPDYIKLDRDLVADIHLHRVKQAIVRGICCMCSDLSITPVAEGVEREEEYRWLRRAGIRLFQGYYFARPSFEALAEVPSALF